MAWWSLGRNRREPAAAPTSAASPIFRPAEHDGAWRDLPALQRTLADPLRPVAVGDDFRDSLSSYADPSFVAPLAHQIDPTTGGRVEGLASPGIPYARASGPELAVPPRPRPAPTKPAGFSTTPTPTEAAPVQRMAISSGPSDPTTVPLELPDMESATPDFPIGSEDPEPPSREDRIPTAVNQTPVEIDQQRPSFAASIPADPRSKAAAPTTPARELPAVARSVDSTAGPELPKPTSAEPGLPSAPEAWTRNAALPVVSRSAEPDARTAPLNGFAEAITTTSPAGAAPADSGEAAGSDDHATASDDDHPAQPAFATSPVPLQRLTPKRESESEAEPPVVVPAPPVVQDSSTPVVEPHTEAGSSAAESAQPQIATGAYTPTLGVRLPLVPMTIQRTPMTERVVPSAEPTAQRVEFVNPTVVPAGRPRPSSVRPAVAPSTGPTPALTPTVQPPPPRSPAVQRLPSPDGKRGSNATIEPPLAVSRRETRVQSTESQTDGAQAAAHGAAMAALDQPPATEDTIQRLQSAEPGPLAPAPANEVTVRPEPESSSGVPATETIIDLPVGPVVTAEPWPSHTRTSTSGLTRPALQAHGSAPPTAMPTLSRVDAAAPAYPIRRSSSSTPTVSVGPSIPLHRVAADQAPSERPPAPPLIVSRQVSLPGGASSESRSSGEMSFVDMFGSGRESESGSPAEDGFTSVQLQSAGDSGPPASEPTTESAPSAPPTSSSAPPAAAGPKPADLDELARRLYEPLTARLRAELWLDRERAGVPGDV
jgi:hypothetical protein